MKKLTVLASMFFATLFWTASAVAEHPETDNVKAPEHKAAHHHHGKKHVKKEKAEKKHEEKAEHKKEKEKEHDEKSEAPK